MRNALAEEFLSRILIQQSPSVLLISGRNGDSEREREKVHLEQPETGCVKRL